MSRSITIKKETFSRLQSHAEPLVDTIESVINKILDAYEVNNNENSNKEIRDNILTLNPFIAPDLTHSKVIYAEINGKPLDKKNSNWNGILNILAESVAKDAGNDTDKLHQNLSVRFVKGLKTDEGFRYLQKVGISVQGQDANGSWRAIAHAIQALGYSLILRITWRDREGAFYPGKTGEFCISSR
ncbi:hypothetical protein GS501_05745 [Saccharibacter sp. 17.LH.SD]|uniref:T4SS efffector SepA family protein n=1 Tax=Saccharibacter sp. 17.LH.SD TaxID=2689393 RepID=UPI0013707FC3|nr:hypothetical protein [Saccharibacter sp. 17.LH.SD]MXV44551.1 hypothetical protein [Saccharibacter sp. 17.LH.SD]